MSGNEDRQKSDTSRLGWKANLLICALILGLAAGFIGLIFSTEPTATRTGATKETAMLVETTAVREGTFHPTIVAVGTVRPARDIILSPRVRGTIIERSPEFTPGGFVEKDQILLRIDPADYKNLLEQRKSDLQQAVADLNVEMGRQTIAQKDYQILNESLSGENKSLVLRQPQLNSARARVRAARAAVRQAELELQRTVIKAPFDAHILSRNANLGSQVSVGDNLGRLVGVDTYWVETTVPQAKLRWLSFPQAPGEKGSEVRIRNRSAWPEGTVRIGHLDRLVGALEGRTRLARVLVTVEDPLGYRSRSSDLPPLMIGAYVEARIQAKAIPDVIRLDRDYVRTNDTVWIMKDGRLAIRDVRIVFRDTEYAYIQSGLQPTDPVVTTNLTTVVDGARLRKDTTANDPESDSQSTDGSERPSGGTS